jgi:DNA-binding MarR family transcriptional regulator
MAENRFQIQDVITFSDPNASLILFAKKSTAIHIILHTLVQEEKTLYDLKRELHLNPGVIKRHIDELLYYGFIKQVREARNDIGMTLKYYRAKAKRFKFRFDWDDKKFLL